MAKIVYIRQTEQRKRKIRRAGWYGVGLGVISLFSSGFLCATQTEFDETLFNYLLFGGLGVIFLGLRLGFVGIKVRLVN